MMVTSDYVWQLFMMVINIYGTVKLLLALRIACMFWLECS